MLLNYKTVSVLGDKGRVVLPAKIREAMQIEKGDALVIEYQDGIIQIYAIDTDQPKKIQE